MNFADRFWSKVLIGESPLICWPWLSSISHDGYGQFWNPGATTKAHRIAYEQVNGPIDERLTIDHLYRNRSCCNPCHLEAVSFKENVLRGIAFSAVNAAKTCCPKCGGIYVVDGSTGRRRCRTCAASNSRAFRQRAKS